MTFEQLNEQLGVMRSRQLVLIHRSIHVVGKTEPETFWALTGIGWSRSASELTKRNRVEKMFRAQTKTPPPSRQTHDSLYKWSYRDFPRPFVSKSGVNVLFVSAHSEMEMRASISAQILERFNNITSRDFLRGGNVSDYIHLPTLSAQFVQDLIYTNGTLEGTELEIMWKLDLHTDINALGQHNIITIGLGNVNSLTRYLLEDLPKKGVKLPIHPESSAGHFRIISEISGKAYNYSDYAFSRTHPCMLLMVPNVYSKQDRVILIVGGTEIQGTVAGVYALCKRDSMTGKATLTNNKFDDSLPAKVVQAVTSNRKYISPLGVKTTWSEVVDFRILE